MRWCVGFHFWFSTQNSKIVVENMKKKERKSAKALIEADIKSLHDEIALLQTKIKKLTLKAAAVEEEDDNDSLAVGDSVLLCGGSRGKAGEVVKIHEIMKMSVWVIDKDDKCYLKRKNNVVKVKHN
jgi:uncharacterized protein YlxW (UPF0749 family)